VSELQEEFAQAAARLIQQARTLGYTVTLGEAWRTPAQAQLDAENGSGIADSLHCERLAIDLNFFWNGAYVADGSHLADIGAWWKSQGDAYRWGGDFTSRPDGNHFSITPDGVRA